MMLKDVLRVYIILGLLSFFIAGIWQSMRLPSSSPDGFVMLFYQHVLGDVDGRSCPSYPVCSVYAREALDMHGWLLGSWLAMDRLIHEGDDLKNDSLGEHMIVFEGERRLYDPLSRNDFWLKKE